MSKIIDRIDDLITERTGTVIIVFLLVTGIFLVGATQISSDSSTSQFTQDIPSQEALESINEEFSNRRPTASTGQTLLIQQRSNVLSKDALVSMAKFEKKISQRSDLRVVQTQSVAKQVALRLNPAARTPSERVETLESATQSEIEQATRKVLENPSVRQTVSNDYNSKSVSADAHIVTVVHEQRGEAGESSAVGTQENPPLQDVQLRMQELASNDEVSVIVFGSGIQSAELSSVIFDSLKLVIPAAVLSILLFLGIAYRDPFDMILGLISLGMALIWTFGFMGLAGLPFTQLLVAVPPLLLAVGIDFGIHAINRYREEAATHPPNKAMRNATDQLLVAFAIVTGTTVIGFGSNITSPLSPIADFGIIAGVGIVFTFLVFGIFLPALKLKVDELRKAFSVPSFATQELGNEDSLLGRSLLLGVEISERVPTIFVLIILVGSGAAGVYGTGVQSTFSEDTFLPPEEQPEYVDYYPKQLQPNEYQITRTLNIIEEKFEGTGQTTLTLYISDNVRKDTTLEQINRLNKNPPEVVVENEDGTAQQRSILTVLNQSKRSPAVQEKVTQNDINNNGIPDDNLDSVYDTLGRTNPSTSQYLTESRSSTRVIYTIESDASNREIEQAGEQLASETRLDATPTGPTIVRQAVSDLILESTVVSVSISLVVTTLFLIGAYRYTDGIGRLGLVNVIPVFVTIALLAGTMRYFSIPLNALTATTLSIAIGLGVDYTTHMTHRLTDEDEHRATEDAVRVAVQGTGGALFGSMVTTVFGIGSLALAITPLLGQFGLIIALGIFYSFLTSVLLLPSLYRLLIPYSDPN